MWTIRRAPVNISHSIQTLLECIGEDPSREGLLATPERYAKAMLYFTKGYEENLRDVVNNAVFTEDADELGMPKLRASNKVFDDF